MADVFKIFRNQPLLLLVVFVPLVLLGKSLGMAPVLLFVLSILAIVPLAALLSLATEQVAARTGDTVGGLLNATLGNLTELIIALAALRAGEYLLVKASLAGVLVTNMLFMTGAALFLGGLRHHVQEYNLGNARLQVSMLLLAAIGLLIPSAMANADQHAVPQHLSLGISLILIATYVLALVFTLGTHRKFFSSAAHGTHGDGETLWPLSAAATVLAVVTVCVALVSEVFIESLEVATHQLGLSPAFVGFVIVALVGGAAEMVTAFSAARANRLDLSLSISLGSSTQIALFVAPVLVLVSYFLGPQPMSLQFWPGAVAMIFMAILVSALVTTSGRSAWFIGVLMMMVYATFALSLALLPPAA